MARSQAPRRFLALNLSASHVSLCAFSRRGRVYVLEAADRFTHPDGLPDARRFLEAHGLVRSPVHVILSGADVVYETLSLKPGRRDRLDEQVRAELTRNAGGPVPVVAWSNLGPSSSARNPSEGRYDRSRTVLAAGLKPSALARALPLVHQLGLRLRGIAPLSEALLALAPARSGKANPDQVVLYLGPDHPTLLAGHGLCPVYKKRLRREPPAGLKHPEEAWRFPCADASDDATEDPIPETALTDSDPSLLIEEVARLVASLESQGRAEPRRLLITGDLKPRPDVDQDLETRIGIPVERLDAEALGVVVPTPSASTPGAPGTPGLVDLYAPALGLLALCRRGQALNLRPRRQKQPGTVLRPLVAAAAAATLTWGILHHASLFAASGIHRQALASLTPPPPLEAKTDPDAPARGYLTGSPLPEALAALSADVPPNLLLTRMQLARQKNGQWVLWLEGLAGARDGRDPVAAFGQFLGQLDAEPWIGRVEVEPWTIHDGSGDKNTGRTLRFKCHARVKGFDRRAEAPSTGAAIPDGSGGTSSAGGMGEAMGDHDGTGSDTNLGTTNPGGGDAIQPITPTTPVTDDWFKEER